MLKQEFHAPGLLGAATLQDIPEATSFLEFPALWVEPLAMNAGAYGGETWDVVRLVETIDRHGDIHRRDPSDYKVGLSLYQWSG
jgi:UDP-N-acetylmuramate dehydrogenase